MSAIDELKSIGLFLLKQRAQAKKLPFSLLEDGATKITVGFGEERIVCVFSLELIIPKVEYGYVFCSNTRQNALQLCEMWESYVGCPKTTVFFIDLSNGNKWSIKPFIHDKIMTPKTMKTGIMSLFENSCQ